MPKTSKSAENKERAALQQELKELQEQEAELTQKVEAPESTPRAAGGSASAITEEDIARAEIVRDPYNAGNPHKILSNPPGKVLRWLNVAYREMRGMKGWTPVRYDDAIGRDLPKYIGEPPPRMSGTAQLDDVVRRGDTFLAWIDRDIWVARQLKRTREAGRRMAPHSTPQQESYGQHASTYEKGYTRDGNPYQEVRTAPGFVNPNKEGFRQGRKQAGRNMFEEAPDEE